MSTFDIIDPLDPKNVKHPLPVGGSPVASRPYTVDARSSTKPAPKLDLSRAKTSPEPEPFQVASTFHGKKSVEEQQRAHALRVQARVAEEEKRLKADAERRTHGNPVFAAIAEAVRVRLQDWFSNTFATKSDVAAVAQLYKSLPNEVKGGVVNSTGKVCYGVEAGTPMKPQWISAGGIDEEGSATNRHLVWDTDENPDAWVAKAIFVGFGDQVTLVTDLQYDTSSKQIQKKTRTITYTAGVITLSAESAWTIITGGQAEACP